MGAATLYLNLLDRGLRLRVDVDDRLIVSPGELLTADDRVAVRHHRDELKQIVSYMAIPPGPADTGTGYAVPSRCVGPTACRVLGVCGREACTTDEERGAFEVAVSNARAERTPHRATDFYDATAEAA